MKASGGKKGIDLRMFISNVQQILGSHHLHNSDFDLYQHY